MGPSGAVLGILAGYAVMFPDQTILFGFLIPMKSKYFVLIIAAVVLLQAYTSVHEQGQGIAVVAQLGGMLTGLSAAQGQALARAGAAACGGDLSKLEIAPR